MERARVTSFGRDLGFDTYDELWRWSIDHRDRFWSAAARALGIAFRTGAEPVLDESSSPTEARWWPHAQLNIVDSCFRHDAGRTAVIHQRGGRLQRVSYGELSARVSAAAAVFSPGQVVGLVMPMTLDAVVTYLAVIHAGGTTVSVAESYSGSEIARRLAVGGAGLVVVQDVIVRRGRVLPLYEKVADAGGPAALVVRTGSGGDLPLRDGDFVWTPVDSRTTPSPQPPVAVSSTAPMHVLFSSGTTSQSKAVPWTHLTPIKSAMDAAFHHDVGPDDVLCWPTSFGWMMGPWLVFASLVNGASMALFDDAPTDPTFGPFVTDAGVTCLGLVPSLVASWRSSGALDGIDLSGIRRFSSTGEASHAPDMRWLSHLAGDRPIIEYCGGTEIGGGYLTGTMVQPCLPSAFSTPALGLDLEILDEDGSASSEGEAFLVPPSVGLSLELLGADHDASYYEGVPRAGLRRHGDRILRFARPPEAPDSDSEEPDRAGDEGSAVPGVAPPSRPPSYYRALGRVDDTMNLGGIKVSSAELERVLLAVDGISEVAAIGRRRAEAADLLHLFIVPAHGSSATDEGWIDAAQHAISSGLNPLFRVTEVTLLERLPRTASGKVMRRTLREQR